MMNITRYLKYLNLCDAFFAVMLLIEVKQIECAPSKRTVGDLWEGGGGGVNKTITCIVHVVNAEGQLATICLK